MGSGGVLAVDTAELDELCGRLRRTADLVSQAGSGLQGLGGLAGLAVGADAVHDALADLARQWQVHADRLGAHALGLQLSLEQARQAYESCEERVSGLVCLRGPGSPAGPDPR